MSCLSKKLMILFSLIAIAIVLMISIVVNVRLVVILNRTILGGIIFGLLGAIIGQIISYNVSMLDREEGFEAKEEPTNNRGSGKDDQIEEEMEPLTFAKIEKFNNSKVINENPDKMAKLIKNSID